MERKGLDIYASTDRNGLAICVENEEGISERYELFEVFSSSWCECIRSHADIIFALEHTLKKLKTDFVRKWDVDYFSANAIKKASQGYYGDTVYKRWRPEDDEEEDPQ